jgi:hypothetical protein
MYEDYVPLQQYRRKQKYKIRPGRVFQHRHERVLAFYELGHGFLGNREIYLKAFPVDNQRFFEKRASALGEPCKNL